MCCAASCFTPEESFYRSTSCLPRTRTRGGVDAEIIRDPNQADAAYDPSEYDKIHTETIRVPNEADFLAVYSSSQGYGSFRNTEKGSTFVRLLSDELLKMKPDEEFYKVLTRVNRRVGNGYKPNIASPNVVTQMPCFISHLTKDVILKPAIN